MYTHNSIHYEGSAALNIEGKWSKHPDWWLFLVIIRRPWPCLFSIQQWMGIINQTPLTPGCVRLINNGTQLLSISNWETIFVNIADFRDFFVVEVNTYHTDLLNVFMSIIYNSIYINVFTQVWHCIQFLHQL